MTKPTKNSIYAEVEAVFDESWYVAQYPEVAHAEVSALEHYLEVGDEAGCAPTPLFDAAFYSTQYPSISHQGGARLFHYLTVGEKEGASPSPLFDPDHYLKSNPQLESVEGSLLGHFCRRGAFEMRSPNPLFSPDWYRDRSAGKTKGNPNPLLDYIDEGDLSGLTPHPLFDPVYYGAQHPEIPTTGGARLAHYLREGSRDGSSPHIFFRPQFYRAQAPRRDEDRTPGLVHYLAEGEAQGLLPNPLFDPEYYLRVHPDLMRFRGSLLEHYSEFGAQEGRRTSPLFAVEHYLRRVRELGIEKKDLMRHYLEWGDAAGLSPHPIFDPDYYTEQLPDSDLGGLSRIEHFLLFGDRAKKKPHPLFDSAYYAAQLTQPTGIPQTLLGHYIEIGERKGLKPNPLFHPEFYAEQFDPGAMNLLEHCALAGRATVIAPSFLFDPRWVARQMPVDSPSALGPLEYYLREEGDMEDGPHPLFAPRWYAAQHPEVGESGMEPLAHFMEQGAEEGLDPHPLFSSAWYRDFYAECIPPSMPSINHYIETGFEQGFSPNPFFNSAYYASEYAGDFHVGESALGHYIRSGISRGYQPSSIFAFCLQFFRGPFEQRKRSLNPAAGFLDELYAGVHSPGAELPIRLRPVHRPDVSIIIPVFGQLIYTLACLRSISMAKNDTTYEVLVVDDHSPVAQFAPLAQIDNLRLIRNSEQLGFLMSCNRAVQEARGRELVLLNNDTLVTDHWLDALLDTRLAYPNAGLIGSQLIFPDGRLQEAGSIVWDDGSAANYGSGKNPDDPQFSFARKVDYVSAASIMIAAEDFSDLSGFDKRYVPAYYEDTDLAFRVRESGKDVVYQAASKVIHFGGASHGRSMTSSLKAYQARNALLFREKWDQELKACLPPGSDLGKAALRGNGPHALVVDATMLTPDQDSGSLRMFNFLRLLVQLGFSVSFVPGNLSDAQEERRLLERYGIRVVSRPYVNSVKKYLQEFGGAFELCVVSRPDTAKEHLDSVKLLCPNALILYDTVDLHFLRRERELRLTGVAPAPDSVHQSEIWAIDRSDGTIAVSEHDREVIQSKVPGSIVHVVSNIHEAKPMERPFLKRDGILFIGSFAHTPNVDAVLWFVSDVLPVIHEWVPDLRFHVIGLNPPDEIRDLASDRVLIEGYLKDVEAQFGRRRLSVAPLRYGSGVKGKINQSMAYGLPCVATPVAVEGMDLDWESEIMVAEDPRDFAEAVVEVYENEALWSTLSANSNASIERSFSMQVAKANIVKMLREHGFSSHGLG